jgi:aspartokinase
VTAVGVGVGDQPDAMAYARRALGAADVPLVTSFARGEALTCVVPSPEVVRGVRALHRAFIEAPEVSA